MRRQNYDYEGVYGTSENLSGIYSDDSYRNDYRFVETTSIDDLYDQIDRYGYLENFAA